MSRNNQRRHLDQDMRLLLLEQDADALEKLLVEVKAATERTNRILIGLLISVVTGVLVYAAQLLLGTAAGAAGG